jgi:hypothetical protein
MNPHIRQMHPTSPEALRLVAPGTATYNCCGRTFTQAGWSAHQGWHRRADGAGPADAAPPVTLDAIAEQVQHRLQTEWMRYHDEATPHPVVTRLLGLSVPPRLRSHPPTGSGPAESGVLWCASPEAVERETDGRSRSVPILIPSGWRKADRSEERGDGNALLRSGQGLQVDVPKPSPVRLLTEQGVVFRWFWMPHDGGAGKPVLLVTGPGDVVHVPAGGTHARYGVDKWSETVMTCG